MNVKTVGLESLVPDSENPRKHDDRNMDAIISSLKAYGQVEPIVVQQSSNMIIAGNARVQAMKKLGYSDCQAVMLDVDDVVSRKLSIALNRSGELAGWNEETLAKHLSELSDLDDFDAEELGFSDTELMKLVSEFEDIMDEVEIESPSTEQVMDGEYFEDANKDNLVKIPAGLVPDGMKSSHIRMVQLFFNEETEPSFRFWVRALSEVYQKDNISDTVWSAIKEIAEQHGIGGVNEQGD